MKLSLSYSASSVLCKSYSKSFAAAQELTMSSWNGIEDDASNQAPLSPTPPSSLFSAAFRIPRPPGIQTGMRDVPPHLSEHPEDLHDASKAEFDKAVIKNPNRRNKTRLTLEEHGHMIRHLKMTESTWRGLPASEKGSQERNRRVKALKFFEMKGTLLMRKPETVAPGTDHETHLPLRQVVLDHDVHYVIKQVHERLGHSGYRKTYEAVRPEAYGISREEVKWFIDHCLHCEMNRPNRSRAPSQPIESGDTNKRCQIDLIDMRAEPSGPYNWILTTKDHFGKFVTLWPLRNKTAQEIADALDIFLMCCGPWEILQCGQGAEFEAAAAILMRRHGIKVIYSSSRHPESQCLVEQANGQIQNKIRIWRAETGLENWDLALTTIALQLNHSPATSTGRNPYELRFNDRSYFTSASWIPYERREFMRLEQEGENDEQTPGDIYVEDIREAVAQRREFDSSAVAGSMPQALQSRQPLLRSLQIPDLPALPPQRQSPPLPPPSRASYPSALPPDQWSQQAVQPTPRGLGLACMPGQAFCTACWDHCSWHSNTA